VTQILKKSRIAFSFTLMMVAALLAGPSIAMAQGTAEADVTSEPMTILLMVSDARAEADVQAGTETENIESGNSDVMVVVHLDPDQQACRALNLLPNTRVEVEGVGNTRLNQVMSQNGIEGSVSVVEELLGVEIDHYGVIDLDGVILAIDAIGGITVNNPEAFTVGTNEFPAGEITLSGEQALLYARQGGEQDAQARLDQQKALVQGLISSVGGATPTDAIPASLQGSVADIQDHVLTDIDLDTALAIANAYNNCVPDEQTVETVMFTEEGPVLDDVTQQEEISGTTDPARVQEYADWLINGGDPLNQ
jgi:polyisoprenyl-teichoic acid--peptidoglycan teichoic acid transferase